MMEIVEQASLLRSSLEAHFAADTAAQGFPWRSDVPSTGHCAAVAVIAHVAVGAEMLSTVVQGFSHWFTRVRADDSAWDVDVTGDQFGSLPVQVALAGYLYSDARARSLADVDQQTMQRARRLADRAGLSDIANTLEVVAELMELRRGFDAWAALLGTRRSGTPALELIEAPLKRFFARAAPNGVIVGKGDRPADDPRYSSDLDIVFDFENGAWVAHFRMDVQDSPVLAHLDVSARSDWDASKLGVDLTRLQQTTDDARARGRKTWTGLVAIGSGFRERNLEVMGELHEFHHTNDVDEWVSPHSGCVWPYVDAVVVPGMCLKKHDLFERPTLQARRAPVLYPFPVGGYPGLEEIWPLVPARAFLASYLRKTTRAEAWDAPAWDESKTHLIMGGATSVGVWPEGWRVIALSDATPSELHHWTGRADVPWQVHVRHGDLVCSSGHPYSLLPRPTFSLTEKNRRQLIAILRQDPRWHQLADTGSQLVAELSFPEGLQEEIDRLVETARSLGYEAEAHLRFVKAKDAPRTITVSINVPSDSSMNVEDTAALRALLSPDFVRATRIAAQLQLEPMERWLQERGWSYDAADIVAKSIGNAVVFAFRERTTQQSILLVVLGDSVEQLPALLE